jgi:hypothetical protein
MFLSWSETHTSNSKFEWLRKEDKLVGTVSQSICDRSTFLHHLFVNDEDLLGCTTKAKSTTSQLTIYHADSGVRVDGFTLHVINHPYLA